MKYLDKINPFMNTKAIKAFSDSHGDLANKLNNVIHVAGTNGKGSTVAFLRSILEANGNSVNVFTSPHLVRDNERIRIQGTLISDAYNIELDKFINRDPIGKSLSIFEQYMAKALLAFNQFPADYTILEVGLGGRLDATNIVEQPLMSIITPIDWDHSHILGNTKALIAGEKAGIIKSHCPVFSAYQCNEVLDVIQKACTMKSAPLMSGGKDWFIKTVQEGKNTLYYLDFHQHSIKLKNIGLPGVHQVYNAGLAIVALLEVLGGKLSLSAIETGLQQVSWFGRLQYIEKHSLYGYSVDTNSLMVLDGAHNVHGALALCDFIKAQQDDKKIYLIIAMLKTKDLASYLSVFSEIKHLTVFAVPLPEDFEAFPAKEITAVARQVGLTAFASRNVADALNQIYQDQGSKLIIICGSLYLIGSVLQDNNIIPE